MRATVWSPKSASAAQKIFTRVIFRLPSVTVGNSFLFCRKPTLGDLIVEALHRGRNRVALQGRTSNVAHTAGETVPHEGNPKGDPRVGSSSRGSSSAATTTGLQARLLGLRQSTSAVLTGFLARVRLASNASTRSRTGAQAASGNPSTTSSPRILASMRARAGFRGKDRDTGPV